jgi:integrase/recombinase XerD
MNADRLSEYLDAYIGLREALGFQMRTHRTLLRDFVRFVTWHGDDGPLRAQLAVDWACSSTALKTRGGAARRLSMARGFLTYLRAFDPATEVPDSGLLAAARRPTPYLFSPPQIHALITAALESGPPETLWPYTFSTLIGLLASTGLRGSEALRLTLSDVHTDLSPPRLVIQETKFHKSRLVPLHPTTAHQLRDYTRRRALSPGPCPSDVFFLSRQGQPLTPWTLRRWFQKLCCRLDFWPTDGGPRPTPHAFRHTFAVERLRLWHQQGADVQALLPHLSVYLGHVRPQESYWYLTATPELLSVAATRFQRYATGE